MMKVTFRDGTSTVLSLSYLSVVFADRRAVRAVRVADGAVLFDRP